MAEVTGRPPADSARTAEGAGFTLPKALKTKSGKRSDFVLPPETKTLTGAPVAPSKIEFQLGTPEFEEMLTQTRRGLRTAGYAPEIIDSLTNAAGLQADLPSDLDLGALYETMRPVFKENEAAIEETWKIAQQLKDEDGLAISAMEWSVMRNLIGIYANEELNLGGKTIAGLSEARSFWKKAQRAAGDKLAGTVAEGVADFSMGLAMLDAFSWVNKKFKLQFVPGSIFIPGTEEQKAARAELEARILPKIVLDDGHEYQVGTSAAFHVLGQRMAGFGMKTVAAGARIGPGALVALFPNSQLKDIVEETISSLEAAGEAKSTQAVGQIPNLVASLGQHLNWLEVVERNWEPHMDLDAFYAGLNDMGLYGDIAMGAIVGGDAIAELVADPILVFGSVQSRLPRLGRAILGRIAPGKAAKITADVARSTHRLEDALDAVAAARKDLTAAEELGKSQAATTKPARMSKDAYDHIILKRSQLAREEQWLDTFADAGPNEQIIMRSARRSEVALPPTSKLEAYVDLAQGEHGPSPIRGVFPTAKQSSLLKEMKELQAGPKTPQAQERIAALGDEMGKLGVLSDEEAGVVGRLLDERANLSTLLRGMTKGEGKKSVQARLSAVNKEINNVLERGRESFDLLNKVSKTRRVPRDINEVTKELDEMRRAALQRDADMAIDWDKVDDLPLWQQRVVLGPDDTEQSADAMNHFVRTGGVGIDDVATTPTNIEYSIMPQSQQGLINWRALDMQNDIVRAEREFQTVAKQYTLESSARRSIARQVHVARKALGVLRKAKGFMPNSTRIDAKLRVFEKELVNLKAAGAKIPKGMKDDFDPSWLPKAQETIMETPTRFNSWLEKAGDRVARSLYPGGLITSHFGNTKAGQVLAPLREPQRFMETYDPALWDRVRSGHLRQRQMQAAFFDEATTVLEDVGVMKRRSKFNPFKDWNEFTIDMVRGEKLFNLTDEVVGSPQWTLLAEAADPQLLAAHDKIRKMFDHAADLQGISDTSKYLTGYMRHVISRDQFAGGARPIEYIGLPAKAEVFASHLMDRGGSQNYPRDIVLALDMYGRAMSKKIVMEPLYDDIIRTGGELAAKHNNKMFQTYANDMVHSLKGKPQFVGKKIDEALGGALNADGKMRWQPNAIDRALGGMTGLMYTGALGANPRYPIMQIATGIATTAGRFGVFRTTRALWEMATLEGQAINKQLGTYQEFLDIFESDFARKLTTAIARKVPAVTPMGLMTTAQTETYIRGVTAHAAIDMYMTKFGFSSWTEAKAAGFQNRIAFEALRAAEEVNHMFGALGRSPWATRTLSPTKGVAIGATQFLSFIPKQTEELLSQMNRSPGKIIEYMAMSGWMSRIAAEELGIDLTSYVGLGYGPETPTDMTSPAVDVFMKGLDLMDAMSRRDPKAVSDAATRFQASGQTLIPTIVAFESAGKAAERLSTAAHRTVLGDKQRQLDFPSMKELQGTGLEGLARAIRPSADPARAAVDPMAGLGGDLLPTLGMQQNIRDNVFRRAKRATIREERRFAFNLDKTVRNYLDALEDGDEAKMLELEGELADTYQIRLTSGDAFVKAQQAKEIAWGMRQVLSNDVLLDRFLKIYEDFGLEITP